MKALTRRASRKAPVTAAALLLLAITATACSSSGASTAAGTSTTAGTVRVGFVAPTSGPQPYPTETAAIQGGLAYVNDTLHGVNGKKLQIDVCQTDGTAQANVNCANKFVSNHDVVVLDGYDLADGAEQPILDRAGISMVGVVASNETQDTSPNDFYFGPSSEAFGTGPTEILKKEGITSIAFTAPNLPAIQTYVQDALLPPAKKLGVNLSVSYFDASNTNWAATAATLGAKHASLIFSIAASEAQCTSLLQALRAANVTSKIFLGGCSAFVQSLGAQASAGVMSYTALWQPNMAAHAPAVIQAQLAAYKKAMTAIGQASVVDQHGVAAFATVVDADEVLSMIKGSITPATVKQQFLSLKNWQPFLDPPATCNHKAWPGTSTCTATLLLTKIAADGSTEPAVGTGFQPVGPLK